MSAHTPGPWGWRETGKVDGGFVVSAVLGDVAYALGSADSMGVEGDEPEANARLIAAAPDLLAACMELVAQGEDTMRHHDDGALKAARAAIAKARGK